MVRAGPSLSCSPRSVIVSERLSRAGTSTDTPVASSISFKFVPLGPMTYLCCDFLTSTDTVWHFFFYKTKHHLNFIYSITCHTILRLHNSLLISSKFCGN